MSGYLSRNGRKILENGYNVIPIKPGFKFPTIKDAQTVITTPQIIAKWLTNGHADAGVGIVTGKVSFIDNDTPDPVCAAHMQEWIEVNIGYAPIRVGNAPKHGLMFRSPNPFRKIVSKTWIDDDGHECRTEVLGIGQQFVAYHIHPDINKPYRWTPNDNPLVTRFEDLPPITEEQAQATCDELDRYAEEHGWKVKVREPRAAKPGSVVPSRPTLPARDDEWVNTEPLGLDEDDLTRRVMAIPNNDWDYEDGEINWLAVIMAIHHETSGNEFGKSLAYDWSIQSGKHTNERFEKSWRSFGDEKPRRPVTALYLIKWSNFYRAEVSKAAVNDLILSMDLAGDAEDLRAVAAEAKNVDVDVVDRARVIAALRKNFKRFNVDLTMKDAREMIRYEAPEIPDWLKGWVYLNHADRFFNVDSKTLLTERAFNNTFLQFTGDSLPADIAMRYAKIRTVFMHGYLPGADEIYTLNGREYANTYSERNMPKVPARLEGRDRENVEWVLAHFRNICPDRREREIWISWHAYIVQSRKRPNWAIVLQGTEGDGKNFFGDMMGAVLGGDNCKTVFAKTLEAPHNSWAEGSLFAFIEEVRMMGHNRHDVMNSMKPLITNPTIEIHAKNLSQYNIVNTQAYMLTTNFQNALPLNDADRRYFVIMSQWQSGESIREFLSENPDYFVNLFATLDESAGAIRGWLLAYKLHPEFQPLGRAPTSIGKTQMIEMNQADELVMAEDIIDSQRDPAVTPDIVIVSRMAEILSEKMSPYRVKESACAAMLRQLGFTYLGRMMVDGKRLSAWSRNPSRWRKGTVPTTLQIGKYLKNPL
jgi:hypothetical protein